MNFSVDREICFYENPKTRPETVITRPYPIHYPNYYPKPEVQNPKPKMMGYEKPDPTRFIIRISTRNLKWCVMKYPTRPDSLPELLPEGQNPKPEMMGYDLWKTRPDPKPEKSLPDQPLNNIISISRTAEHHTCSRVAVNKIIILTQLDLRFESSRKSFVKIPFPT